MKISIVAPVHIQPSKDWITSLDTEAKLHKADVIIIDDSDGKVKLPKHWKVFGYKAQEKYLGKDLYTLFEQFHKSSSCKNFGLVYSYRENYDVTIVLDSDCIVKDGFISLHLNFLQAKGDGWINPITETNLYSRGFPYSKRLQDKWCHMGLWTNELDLYGKDRIGNDNITKDYMPIHAYSVAPGFIPLSGMNLSFVREALPFMLFLPNFTTDSDEKFIRHDDIFGGYIFQKIAHMKNKSLSYGLPIVYHDTIVHPEEDAAEEEPMYKYEDEFYAVIDIHGIKEAGLIWPTLEHAFKNSKFKNLLPAFNFQSQAYANI